MKTDNQTLREVLNLESQVIPVIRQGLNALEGPSEAVLSAIHDEAVRQVFLKRSHFATRIRVCALAASLLVLAGGTLQYQLARRADLHEQTLHLVLNIGDPGTAFAPVGETTELANRLLNIQGLDADTFFNQDETGILSL